jgi:PAS domain S-box-containing protein
MAVSAAVEKSDTLNQEAAIRAILEGTAAETGDRFFTELVRHLAAALKVDGAWVTEVLRDQGRLRSLAFWHGGRFIKNYEYDVAGTPCEPVLQSRELVQIPDRVAELFPGDPDLARLSAVSYMGIPLLDSQQQVLGNLAVLDSRPLQQLPRMASLMRIFAARATAELRRIRAEQAARQQDVKLRRLVESTLDGIIELDRGLTVSGANRSASAIFAPGERLEGRRITDLLQPDSASVLQRTAAELASADSRRSSTWIAGGLQGRRRGGQTFAAEATLSRIELGDETYFSLVLRDVQERLEAERRIRALTDEAEYLRRELRSLRQGDRIIGDSPALRQLLDQVGQVAGTDATVLIQGETGTGKELVARMVHAASRRSKRPLVRVNCAAVPATLMESEFFGHEKGAFTGATQRRRGRFELADGGTLFLDEVGELPLELQPKLLRALQEGELEPVGGSKTLRVDVRVVAATNRDLHRAVARGAFREDLFYRLAVFPLEVPPLHRRGDDVLLLAEEFTRRASRRVGRLVHPPRGRQVDLLRSYRWPGNVRELQNVIERAVITARGGELDLAPLLPRANEPPPPAPATPPPEPDGQRILTSEELRRQERDNMLRALQATGWRVAGERGAARLLGLAASTLSSRMKALGIRRPAS